MATVIRIGAIFVLSLLIACTMQELQLGEELEKEGNWDGAVAAYRDAFRKDPFNKDLEEKLLYVKSRAAEQHFALGREWLKQRNIPEALQEFQVALGLDPENPEHHAALNDAWRLKTARQTLLDAKQVENLGRFDEALALYETAVELDPSLPGAIDGITRVVQQQQKIEAIGDSAEPVTLRFQNTRLKQVFEILARTANIDILFDKDVRDDLVTIFTKDTPFIEALNLILTTNQLFAKRAGPDRLLIIPDTKQKREQYEDLQIRTFYLSNAKAKDMANLLRTILETKRVYVNEPLNTVVIRDHPNKIALAEHVILANDRHDAEVVLDLEVLEVNRTKTKAVGLNFAKQAGLGIFPDGVGDFSTAAQTFTYRNLTSIGQDSYLFTFPSSILMDFFKQESDAKTLANPKLRVLNNQKASINIGDKQPILLSTTNVLPGQATTGALSTTSTVTSIEFKDTGIKLTVEPTIHLNNSITLRLQVEVTRLGDRVVLQADPEISQFRFGTRTADTALSMRDGETVVLAGLIQEEDRQSREAIPGVDEVPGLGDLLSNRNTDKITTEVIVVITPRIVRNLNPPHLVKQTLWSGTAKQYNTKPLFSHQQSKHTAFMDESRETQTSPITASPSPNNEPTDFPTDDQEPVGPDSEAPETENSEPEGTGTLQTSASQLQILPAAASIKVGESISITLQGQNFSASEQASLTLTYDPAIMTFKEAIEGSFLTGQQVPPSLSVSTVPNAGQLVIQMGQPGKPVQGSGVLASLEFEAISPGTTPIQIQNPTVLGANAQPIPVRVQHGKIWVEE